MTQRDREPVEGDVRGRDGLRVLRARSGQAGYEVPDRLRPETAPFA